MNIICGIITMGLLTERLVQGGNILFIAFDSWSNHIGPLQVVSKLENIYGHSFTLLIPEQIIEDVRKSNLTKGIIIERNAMTITGKIQKWIPEHGCRKFGHAMLLHRFSEAGKRFCSDLLTNTKLMFKLKSMRFDMVIIDPTFSVHACYSILAYKLNLPYIALGGLPMFPSLGVPYFPSVTPVNKLMPSDGMCFKERFINTMAALYYTIAYTHPLEQDAVRLYAPERPFIAVDDQMKKVEMYLVDSDPILDFPLPSLPHVQYVGGLVVEDGKQLPKHIEEFMNEADDGVIVVSFGSILAELPNSTWKIVLKALSKIEDMKIIMKHEGSLEYPSDNILTLSWLPQNDLLAHSNTRLFITHCGNNGQYQALYHGVPMLGLPLNFDEFRNCRRIDKKGFGLCLDTCEVDENDIYKSIYTIIRGNFTERVKNASLVFRSRTQSPSERAAYWIDHIMKFGGEHYRYLGADLPFYKLYLLDVFAFILIFLCAIMFALKLFVVYLIRFCLFVHVSYQKKEKIA